MELQGTAFVGMGLAIGLAAIAEGMVIKSVIEGIARQPETAGTLRTLMIIGVAMVETAIIFAFILGLLVWIKM